LEAIGVHEAQTAVGAADQLVSGAYLALVGFRDRPVVLAFGERDKDDFNRSVGLK